MKRYFMFWWILFIVAVLFVNACEPSLTPSATTTTVVIATSTPIPTSTVPTGTTAPPNTCTAVSGPGDRTSALQSLLATCQSIVIDSPLRVDGQILVPSGRTITWTSNGQFYRDTQAGNGITLSFLQIESNDVTLNNVQLRGPNPKKTFTPGALPVCGYYTALEHQHGITFHGAKRAKVNGGRISNLHGDGIYIDLQSEDVTLNNLTVDCVGRTAVTNLGSKRTRINGGTFTTTVWWIFNIELQGETVTDYYIDRPNVGYSRLEFLLANCPYGGSYSGVVINKPVFLPGANPIWKSTCGDLRVVL